MTGKFKVAASTTFYLMSKSEVLNQVGKEVGFTKNFER
jgi:hypothetical protein